MYKSAFSHDLDVCIKWILNDESVASNALESI